MVGRLVKGKRYGKKKRKEGKSKLGGVKKGKASRV